MQVPSIAKSEYQNTFVGNVLFTSVLKSRSFVEIFQPRPLKGDSCMEISKGVLEIRNYEEARIQMHICQIKGQPSVRNHTHCHDTSYEQGHML